MRKAWHIKEKIDKLDSIKIITFCSLKQTAKRREVSDWKTKYASSIRKQTTQFKKIGKIQTTNKSLKICSISLVTPETRIKTTTTTHTLEQLKYKNNNRQVLSRMQNNRNSHILLVRMKMLWPFWKTIWQFLIKVNRHLP